MKQGRIAVFDQIDNRDAAALLVNGALHDLMIAPKDAQPTLGAIYRAKLGRPMKGQGGAILDLGDGQKGFLRGAKGLSEGQLITVQISSIAEPSKATPCTQKIIFKGAHMIWTPGAPGRNIARSIKDDDIRDRLEELAHDLLSNAGTNWGLILRSTAASVADETIRDEAEALFNLGQSIMSDQSDAPCLLYEPALFDAALQSWSTPGLDQIIDDPNSFEILGIHDHIAPLDDVETLAKGAFFTIEPTRAFVAVDVNTGNDTSFVAGQNANIATAKALPRALRLRGLGGQIVVDFAPSPKKDRRRIEEALRAAFKADGIETALVGWTQLGHFELQRKRERVPLTACL
ncbi:MAG: ribonuclease E/G [Pseudomonadota bacterium]